jgi:anaerobic magnesium-protoporphyrin IX monomethyl ester cyclase
MKKILLTHSFLLRFDPKQWNLGHAYAPLGTLYAASVMRQHNIDFQFYDTTFVKDPAGIAQYLVQDEPGILVIYEDGFNYLTKMCLTNMREAAFSMISIAKEKNWKIIVCSSDASDNYSLYLEKGVDFCIFGEGEDTLIELLKSLASGSPGDFGGIRGMAWKDNHGEKVNPARPIITDLDGIPFPAWDLLNINDYRDFWYRHDGKFTLNMVTTRGCPFHCSWCAKPIYGNHYNSRSPQNVVSEMTWLKEKFSPDMIWFADDIFALKPGWIDEFSRLVNLRGIVTPYIIQSRVDLILDNRQVRYLASSGCMKIWLGIESGSQKILDAMNKGITI